MGSIQLVASRSMESNKKADRNEDVLIRLSADTRQKLDVNIGDRVQLTDNRLYVLSVYQAFAEDIRESKGKFSSDVGFVSLNTLKNFFGTGRSRKIEISKYVEKVEKKEKPKILLGADPEFLLFNGTNAVIRANTILGKDGKIGSDGAMIEIRPDPAYSAIKLVDNMKAIFSNKGLTEKINEFGWRAGVYYSDASRGYPLGGHIHIGNTPEIAKLGQENRLMLFSVVNKILDELLAVPLVKLDGKEPGYNRRTKGMSIAGGTTGYGYFGEWRTCDGRLEHRTLSGLWLMHPLLARSVLGTAKAIVDSVYDRLAAHDYNPTFFSCNGIDKANPKSIYNETFSKWHDIPLSREMNCGSPSAFMKTVLNGSMEEKISAAFLKRWYNKLKEVVDYRVNTEDIDCLYNILKLPRNKIESVGVDIRENWLNNKTFSI